MNCIIYYFEVCKFMSTSIFMEHEEVTAFFSVTLQQW